MTSSTVADETFSFDADDDELLLVRFPLRVFPLKDADNEGDEAKLVNEGLLTAIASSSLLLLLLLLFDDEGSGGRTESLLRRESREFKTRDKEGRSMKTRDVFFFVIDDDDDPIFVKATSPMFWRFRIARNMDDLVVPCVSEYKKRSCSVRPRSPRSCRKKLSDARKLDSIF